jgi:hypothetical protein
MRMVQDVPLSRWEDLLIQLRRLGEEWIFRGQHDAGWRLSTTMERSGSKSPLRDEWGLLSQFQRRASNYLASHQVPHPRDVFGWLALMQHYGAPTRLLDFTRSPYVALHFALEKPNSDGHHALWAVNTYDCQRRMSEVMSIDDPSAEDKNMQRCQTDQHGLVAEFCTNNKIRGVIPVEPWSLDDRQGAQQTVFLMAAKGDLPFSENLSALEPYEGMVTRFVISDALRADALRDLRMMNVTAASLFPGLDGLARSMQGHLSNENEEQLKSKFFKQALLYELSRPSRQPAAPK